jgi:hypothetical protein
VAAASAAVAAAVAVVALASRVSMVVVVVVVVVVVEVATEADAASTRHFSPAIRVPCLTRSFCGRRFRFPRAAASSDSVGALSIRRCRCLP